MSYFLKQAPYMVEKDEFRKLLRLLRPELRDQDIPHRTMLREEIITTWQDTFKQLKKDMEVCTTNFQR